MRFEYKYLLKREIEDDINYFCNEHGCLDSNCFNDFGYQIQSVYKFHWKTINGHGRIRLRKYTTSNNVFYYIEEKCKNDGIGSKTRLQIDEDDYNYMYSCESENLFFLKLMKLNFHPSITDFSKGEFKTFQVQYFRIPWKIRYLDNEYRLTLDKDVILTHRGNLNRLIEEDSMILEIKGQIEKKEKQFLDFFENKYNITPTKISKHKIAKKKMKSLNLIEVSK